MPGDSEENNDTENLEADFHQALINEHIVSNWVIVTYDSIPYICKVTASDEDNCVQVTVMTLQKMICSTGLPWKTPQRMGQITYSP